MKNQAFEFRDHGFIPLDTSFNSVKPYSMAKAIGDFALAEATFGSRLADLQPELSNARIQGGLRASLAKLLGTKAECVSLHGNTDLAVTTIANNLGEGSRVIALERDYPSVYEPFGRVRGTSVNFIPEVRDSSGRFLKWRPTDLDFELSSRDYDLVAVSHVQYGSGFRVSLEDISAVCRRQNVKLLVDIAQTAGMRDLSKILELADAVVSPVWKGMLGPRGVAFLATTPEFERELRENAINNNSLRETVRASGMTDIDAPDARALQTSTLGTNLIVGAANALETHALTRLGAEAVTTEMLRLQGILLEKIDKNFARPVLAVEESGGLILSFEMVKGPGLATEVRDGCFKEGLHITARLGFVRFAPGYFLTDDEVERGAAIFNRVARDVSSRY